MKNFYKYLLFFVLGIIIYSFIFKEKKIEGLRINEILDELNNPDSLNRGCLNYTCNSDPSTYDNYQRKIYSSSDPDNVKPAIYDDCSNLSGDEYISSNPNIVSCNNEICCENRICKTEESSITCNENEVFLPNKHCGYGITNAETCTNNICCSSITDNTLENSTSNEGLFQDIINFRNDKGGNISNGDNITGEDIRNYLYYSLLDLEEIDVINNPLTRESRVTESDETDKIFKDASSGEEGVFKINCSGFSGFYQSFYNLKYPIIGDSYTPSVTLTNVMNDDTCARSHDDEGSNKHYVIASVSSFPFLNNKGNLEYIDYELLSVFFSDLNDDEINDRIILIDELENSGSIEQLPENLISLLNNIGGISNPPTKQNIKQMIINLDKILNTNSVNIKPLDKFFHTTIDNHKNSLIDKNIFLGLINQ